nr:MAG TPA: hypothetical protein [Caudoviricetes sp.]
MQPCLSIFANAFLTVLSRLFKHIAISSVLAPLSNIVFISANSSLVIIPLCCSSLSVFLSGIYSGHSDIRYVS